MSSLEVTPTTAVSELQPTTTAPMLPTGGIGPSGVAYVDTGRTGAASSTVVYDDSGVSGSSVAVVDDDSGTTMGPSGLAVNAAINLQDAHDADVDDAIMIKKCS